MLHKFRYVSWTDCGLRERLGFENHRQFLRYFHDIMGGEDWLIDYDKHDTWSKALDMVKEMNDGWETSPYDEFRLEGWL